MKAKDIAAQLGNLAASATSSGSYNDIDIDIPEELQEPDPIFVVEHEKVIESSLKKATKSVKFIVNSVVPEIYHTNPIINDKIEQDAEQLSQLYYQQSMNNVMIKTIMDTIANGDTSAKLFDSYTRLMAMAKDFNKQITELQNQFRKYYIDTYLDLQHKEDEDMIIEENSVSKSSNKTLKNNSKKELTYNEENNENLDRRETSTRDTTLKIQDWKRELYKKEYEKQKENS